MVFDPNRNNPTKVDLVKLKLGLSKLQMSKIAYECELLRIDMDKLLYLAPFLFIDGVTASNTVSTPIKTEDKDDGDEYDNYSNDESFYNSGYL